MTWKSQLTALAAARVMISGAALADEVQIVHDKGFWSESLQKVTEAGTEAIGSPFVEAAYANPEQYKAFIQTSVASGDMPDMFTWWTGGVYEELVASGAVAPLDDVWEELIAKGDFDESVRDFFSVDGVPYAVPLHLGRWIALYNTALFEEVGIGEPESWDDLIDAAEKLKAAGHTPFLATTQDGWRGFIWFQEIMIRTNPEAYKGLHTGEVAYDSEPVRKAFEIWSDWYAKGYFSDPRSNEENEDFVRGRGAIYLIGDWAVGNLASAGLVPGEDFGTFIMPNMDPSLPPSVIVEGGPILLSNAGKEKPEVVEALKYFVSVDGANVWGEASGNSLGNKNANPPNPIAAKLDADVAAGGHMALDRWWEAVPADLQGEIVAEFNRFMLDPTMETAETVMANIQELNADYWGQ